MLVSHVVSGRSGLQWPKDNGTGTIYASGAWFGGLVNGDVRVSVAEFTGEFASGPWGSNHNDEQYKIYKVGKGDIGDPLRNCDFQNWPTDLGAPWIDNNSNGVYEPLPNGPDHPDLIGDQVLWMVMNDGADSLHSVFHTEPLGIEVQRTIFGFDRKDSYGDVMFVKDLIINKGGNNITEMYFGLWSDPDLGNAADDYVGCDTTLGLGIIYNNGPDSHFSDYANGTPAVGYDLFQGPIVPSADDVAYAFDREFHNHKNLNMTSFVKYT